MSNSEYSLKNVDIKRAEHSLHYEFAKPNGVLHIVYCVISVVLLMFIQGAFRIMTPNLLLVFTILISIKAGGYKTIILATISGLLLDVMYGRYIGLYAIMFLYTALLFTLVIKKLFEVKVKTKLCLICIPFFFAFRIIESFAIRFLDVILNGASTMYTNYFIHFGTKIIPNVIVNEIALLLMIIPVFAIWRRTSPH